MMTTFALLLALAPSDATAGEDEYRRRRLAAYEALLKKGIPPIPKVYPPSGEIERTIPPERSATIAARPIGDAASWVSDADRPLGDDSAGTVRVRLTLAPNGKPVACAVVRSVSPRIDQATCRALLERARFAPPRDAAGRPIAAYTERAVAWRSSTALPGLRREITAR